jgi:hypothetical protein
VAKSLSERRALDHATDEHGAGVPLSGRLGTSRGGRSSRRETMPHSHKFVVATAILAGLAVGAIVVAAAALQGAGSSPTPIAWSPWSPPDHGIAGEREIANAVSPLYRADPATQLALVTVRNVSASSNGTQLALRDPSTGTLSALSGTSAIYTLCGLGPNCAIATGAPSAARLLLLRREALELSLYTFRYIPGIDNVVALLPPGQTQAPAQLTKKPPAAGKVASTSALDIAVVFQRAGLSHFLSRPLSATLPEQVPPTVTEMPNASEAELVSVITGQGLFRQQLVQAQDGSSVLVLNQLPPQ